MGIGVTYFISHSGSLAILYGHNFPILPALGNPGEPHDFSVLISTLAYCVLWPLLLMFLPTVFMGASFPLGIALLAPKEGGIGSPPHTGPSGQSLGNRARA